MLDYATRPAIGRPMRFPDTQLVLFDGSAVQAIVARDATLGSQVQADRLTAVERRIEAERARKQAFVSMLAHELRQPLSTLMAGVEVLRLGADQANAGRATTIMKRQIVQMNRLIEDIMDGARWACGKMTLQPKRVDLRDVIADAAQDIAAAVAERGQHLTVTGAEPVWVEADPQRLQQVLSNLLRNAVKYTEPGGSILLSCRRGTASAILQVSDTGRGIEAEALVHIFDLYTQAGADETGGLGIGLSVVREIVELHHGWIEARSGGAGTGSDFIVTLPIK
jgi:signal transduction histidine kinase